MDQLDPEDPWHLEDLEHPLRLFDPLDLEDLMDQLDPEDQ
jgi:hypothetical protein